MLCRHPILTPSPRHSYSDTSQTSSACSDNASSASDYDSQPDQISTYSEQPPRKKRQRTTFSALEVWELERAYRRQPYLLSKDEEDLVQRVGITAKSLKVKIYSYTVRRFYCQLNNLITTYGKNVLKWIKERVSLYFGGGGLILNKLKLSLINLYRVKYLKKAFYFWFQELYSLFTWLATPSCLYKFESNFTIVCSRNPWLILFYAHGYNHQVYRIKRGLKDLFLLF